MSQAVARELVGREEELGAASSLLAGLSAGAGALVLEGEAGIGKTALCRAVVEEATAEGCRTLTCQSNQAETPLAFAGLTDLVDSSADAAIARLATPQREALEIALLRRAAGPGAGPERRTLGVALRGLFCELSVDAPLVLALDDLQWMDASTLQLLAFALRRIGEHPVAVVATLRGPPYAADPLNLERAFGAGRVRRLRVLGLDTDEIDRLLSLHLGRRPSRRLVSKVTDASGGNPLFALECARALGDASSIQINEPLPVPDTLRELVRGRLAPLAPTTREALLAVAALPQPDAATVEAASSAEGLAAAEETGLVRVPENRVEFAHPLYAAAVYDVAASGSRARMHARLATLAEDPDERAQHLAYASGEPSAEIAASLEQAASHARSRGASAAAAGLLELSIRRTPPAEELDLRRRQAQAAEDYLFAGERDRPRALLREVVNSLAPGAERAQALRALAQVTFWHDGYGPAQGLLEEALEQAGESEWITGRALLDLLWVRSQSGQLVDGPAEAMAAYAVAERLSDPQLMAEALSARALMGRMFAGEDGTELMDRALALESWETRTFTGLQPSANAALLCLWSGETERATVHAATVEEQLLATGQESLLPLAALQAVWIECAAGHLARGAQIAEQAVAVAFESDSRITQGVALCSRAIAFSETGQLEAAEADAEQALALFDAAGDAAVTAILTGVRGFMALSRGDAAGADGLLSPMASFVLERGIGEPMMAAFLPNAIEACVALGRLERADELLCLLEAAGVGWDSPWALATAARGRGLWLAAGGDLDSASDELVRALAHHERLGMPLERARTLLAQGQVARRRRKRRDAAATLKIALDTFQECGAERWAALTEAEITRLGLRRAPDELTVTEERVATLAAAGETNKGIAAALFISPKTVEANMSRVYRKLGVRSRAELGSAMTKRTAAPDTAAGPDAHAEPSPPA
jgi:DNA-binding CsgD family transcriptional regulator